jgi:hypothetical protein
MAYNVTAQLNLQLNQQSIAQISQALNSITNGKSIGGNLFNSNGIRNITNELNQSKNAMMQFGEQAGLAAKRFGAFTLTAGSLIQVTQGFRTMLNEAIAFDREMVKLKQVSNETAGSGVAAIRQEIDKLSTGLGVSSSQLARVSVILKQANLNLGETKTALEALALSALAPNFDSMEKTAEGAIAVLKQFKIPVEELKSALGSINAVAGEFAVEASDLIGVIQRTGGAFKAAGGNLNELLALFTSVRQTTRESAESIATGLRTIFTRIQRTGTADALREVGVNLRYTRDEALALGNVDLTSQFVGAYEAVRRLSVALNQIPATDPKFAQLVEELGGYRQISKVIPLIQEFSISQQALNTAITGGASLMNSAAAAQGSFGNRLDKLKESYLQFGRALTDSSAFKTLFTAFETGAQAALALMNVLKPLIPMLTIMATMKMAQSIGSFGAGFVKGVAPAKKSSGGLLHFKRGGIVPGSGHGDIVPAMLEPGEMVIPKRMVKKYSFGGPHTADIDESTLNNPTGFSSYMQGSQTVNPKTGKYRKFFHGTKGQNFDNFSNAHAKNTWFGRGHYFSADAKVASRYSETDKTAGGYDPGARVMSATLQMKNPYTWNSDKSLKDFIKKGGKDLKSINGQFDQKDWDAIVQKGVLPEDISQGTLDHLNKIFNKFPSIAEKWNKAGKKGMSPESKMKFVAHGATQTLKKQGYDSVNVDYGLGRDYFNASTVFDPKQIKSLGNEGGWDPSLKEIGKNLGGLIQKFAIGGDVDESKINNPEGFRAFMKGSKTLNAETGKYKKFFHGTRGDNFNTFNNSKTGGNFYGKAHYFTQDYDSASSYSGQDTVRNIGSRVLPTTLQMKNSYSWDEDKSINDLVTAGEALKARNGKLDRRTWNERIEMGAFPEDISEDTLNHANKIFARFPSIAQAFNKMDTAQQRKFFSHVASKALQKQGFDSINIGNDYSAVFKSNQIKSLYNTGTWDSKNTDIMKNLGGYIKRQRFMAGSAGGVKKQEDNFKIQGKRLRSIKKLDNIASNTKIINQDGDEIFPAEYDFKVPVKMTKLYISPEEKKGLTGGGKGWENYVATTLNYQLINNDPQYPFDFFNKSTQEYADAKDMNYNSTMIQEGRKKALNMLLYNTFGSKGYKYANLSNQKITLENQKTAKLNNNNKTILQPNGKGTITDKQVELVFSTTNPNVSFKNAKQKKASGGFIVPGVGDTDSVPMDLPVGSYVIKKSSTKKMGFANGGVVPALLTPGELVIDPKTASGIGQGKLDHMNRTGRSAFAKGGRVGFAGGGNAFPIPSTTIHTPEQNQSLSVLYNQLPKLYQNLIDDLTKISHSVNETVPLETHRKKSVIYIAGIYEKQMRLSLNHETLLKQGNEAEAIKTKAILDEGNKATEFLMSKSSKDIQRKEYTSPEGKTFPIKYTNDSMENAFKKENPNASFSPPKPLGPPPSKPSSPPPKPVTGPIPSSPPPKPTGPAPTPNNPSGPAPAPTPQPPTPTTPPTGPAFTPPKPPTGPTPSSPSNKPPLGVPPPTPPKPSINPSNLISKLTRVRANKALDDAGVNLKDTGNITQQVKLMEMQKQRAQIEKEYIKHTMLQIKASMPHLKSSERLTLAQGMFADAMKNGTIAVNTKTNKVTGDTRLGGNGEELMATRKAASKKSKEPKGFISKIKDEWKNNPEMKSMVLGAGLSYAGEAANLFAGSAENVAANNGVGSNKFIAGRAASGALQGAAMGAQLGSTFGPMGTLVGGGIGGLAGGVTSVFGANKELAQSKASDSQQKLGSQLERYLNKSEKLDVASLAKNVNANSANAGKAAGTMDFMDMFGFGVFGRSSADITKDTIKASEQARQQTSGQTSALTITALSEKLGQQKGGVGNKTNADLYKFSSTIIETDSNFMGLIESSRQVGESFTQAKERIIKESANMARAEAAKKAGAELERSIGRSNTFLKTFADNLEGASARVDGSFKNFDSIMSSLEGGTRMPQNYEAEKTAKIFNNPAAFSGKEFKSAIESTFSQFGPELTKGLSDQYAPMADIANKLPQVLAESMDSKNPIQEVQSKLEQIIPGAKDNPAVKSVINSLTARLSGKDSLRDISNDSSKISEETLKPLLEPMTTYGAKIAQLNAENANKLAASYAKLNNATMKLVEGMEQADALRIEQSQTIASAQDLMRGGSGEMGPNPQQAVGVFLSQQQRLLGGAGRADLVGNTAGIGNALQETMDRQRAIEQTPAEQMGGEKNKQEAFAKAALQADLFKKSLQDTTQKLQGVANEFAKQAAEMAKQRNAGASLAKKLALGGPEAQRDFKQGLKTFWKLQTGQISARQVMKNPALAARLEKFSEMAGDAKIGGVNVGDTINSRVYEPAANRMFGSPTRQQEAMVKMQEAGIRGEAAKAQEVLNKISSDNIVKANQELIKSQADLALEIQKLTLAMRIDKEKMNVSDNKSEIEKTKQSLDVLNQNNLTSADAEVIAKNPEKFKELTDAKSMAESYGDARKNALNFKKNGTEEEKSDANFLMKGKITKEMMSDPASKAQYVQKLSKMTGLKDTEAEDTLMASATTGNDVEKVLKIRAQSTQKDLKAKEAASGPQLLSAYEKIADGSSGSSVLQASQQISQGGGIEKVKQDLQITQQQQAISQQRIQQLEKEKLAAEQQQQQQQQPLKFAKGGVVPGTGNTDSVSALLTPGEVVIPKGMAEGGQVQGGFWSNVGNGLLQQASNVVGMPKESITTNLNYQLAIQKDQQLKKISDDKIAADKAAQGPASKEITVNDPDYSWVNANQPKPSAQHNAVGQAYLQHTQMFQQAQANATGVDLRQFGIMNQQQIRNYRMQAAAMIGTQMQIALSGIQNNQGFNADPNFRKQAMFRIQQMQATRMNLMGNPRRFNSKEEIDAAVNFYGVSHQGLLNQTGVMEQKPAQAAAPAPAPAPTPAPAPVAPQPAVIPQQVQQAIEPKNTQPAISSDQQAGMKLVGNLGKVLKGWNSYSWQEQTEGAIGKTGTNAVVWGMNKVGLTTRANGGSIMKPQGTDTVPTMLTPGEFVMKKSAVDQIGANKLSQMNNSKSYFAGGGFVGNSANLDQSASFNQAAAGFDGFAASFNTSVTNFNASVETFGAKVAEFASAVSTIPATLTVNGEVGANVTTNAAGIISQISNAVQSMIASQVAQSLPQPSMDQASKPS